MKPRSAELERARKLLCELQWAILESLRAARSRRFAQFANLSGRTEADTIYLVDRISERTIMEWFRNHWPKSWPVEIVMEGIPDGEVRTFPEGVAVASTRWKCILDPIDGTRNLMWDKRSAWSLAALAPQRGPGTSLRDLCVAAMTELPTRKQGVADQISVVRGGGRRGVCARRLSFGSGRLTKILLRPSSAPDFRHGFASFVKFFPEGKTILARFEEEFWRRMYGALPETCPVFDDQYLSSGGQVYELLSGRDRMVADLRPIAARKLGLAGALPCHPYDICTALILEEAGGIVELPAGGALEFPLDLTTPVSWVGFANEKLAKKARPVLRSLLREIF